MEPSATRFAHGKEALDACLSPRIGLDAAHHVVRRRRHRDQALGDIQTMIRAEAVDMREPRRDHTRGQVRYVKKDPVAVGLLHLIEYAARHDVPGRQFLLGRVVGHEPMAFNVAQQATLSPDRLGNQKRGHAGQAYGRGMELEELHVHDLGPSLIGQGYAVASGYL